MRTSNEEGQDKLKDIIRENPDFLKGRRNGFLGKNHSIETKDKMSKIAKKRLMDPTKNPSYGKCWIHNDSESIMVFKDEMEDYIKKGWTKGRKIKFFNGV